MVNVDSDGNAVVMGFSSPVDPSVVDMTPGKEEERLAFARAVAHDEMIRGVRMGVLCLVHTHGEWVPLERHHVWPLGMGGPNIPANVISVCANGHGSIHAYLDHLIRYGEDVPWDLRKHFGPTVRGYAWRGWTEAGQPRRD